MMRVRVCNRFFTAFTILAIAFFVQGCASISVIFDPYPNDESMQATYISNKGDLDVLVKMFKEDSNLRLFSLEKGAVSASDQRLKLQAERESRYREILTKVGVSKIYRIPESDVHKDFYMQVWWIRNGWIQSKSKYFVYTENPPAGVVESLDDVYANGRDANDLKRIDENWYLYLDVW